METISQHLEVIEWPLARVGDEKFFGYVVSVGILPRDWKSDSGMTPYVDFAYGNRYERYRLPLDDGGSLKRQLVEMLDLNLTEYYIGGGMLGKVWIKRLEKGYTVDLP